MANDAAATVPAIVVGRAQTGLGTLRSLRLAGIPAYAACPRDDLVCRSRWFRPVPGNGWDGNPGPETRDILAGIPLARAVLIPGRDDAALWASDLPHGSLAERFPVCSSSRATLTILQDKSRFGEFLAGTGIPHPRTFTIRSDTDIAAIPFDALDRVFVKPADSQKFMQAMGVKGLWARNRAEFEAIWRRLETQQLAVIAQEYVPGGADQHYFIDGFRDRHGRVTGLFARRRLRISPPDFGSSSYCISIPLGDVEPALPGLTELLTRLEYRGIFSAEFKRDARDGALRILEVNTRAWWYVEFAARCGVNVVEMAYLDALEQEVPRAPDYTVGAGCVNLTNDLRIVLGRRGRSGASLPKVLRQWRRAHFAVFRWDDPLPGLAVAARMFTRWMRNRVRSRARGA